MSIPIGITQNEYNCIAKQLRLQDEVICLDKLTHIRVLLVARDMLIKDKSIKAKIVIGYVDA